MDEQTLLFQAQRPVLVPSQCVGEDPPAGGSAATAGMYRAPPQSGAG